MAIFIRSDKLHNESSPYLSNFRPGFSPEFPSEFSPIFSCFVSWETETTKNSPKISAIFQCKIPARQARGKKKKYIYIYMAGSQAFAYLFGVETHLPPAFGPKKGLFFLHKFVRKKNRVLTLYMKKRLLTPISQRFFKNKTRNPLFYSVLAQNVTLPLVMSIMSLMFWVSVSKKCLKRW